MTSRHDTSRLWMAADKACPSRAVMGQGCGRVVEPGCDGSVMCVLSLFRALLLFGAEEI